MLTTNNLLQKRITIKPAHIIEIDQISSVFKQIQITESNIVTKLDPTNPNSFEQSGGFFKIMSTDEIEKKIHSSNDQINVACYQGKIYSVLWCRNSLENYKDMSLDLSSVSASEKTKIQLALNNNTVFAVEEIASISPPEKLNCIYELSYDTYLQYLNSGFTHAMLQIYTISGELINNQLQSLHYENKRSTHITLSLGGIKIGTNPIPIQTVGTRRFIVTANVYIYEISNVLNKLEERLI